MVPAAEASPREQVGDDSLFISGLLGMLDLRMEAMIRTRAELASLLEQATWETEPG